MSANIDFKDLCTIKAGTLVSLTVGDIDAILSLQDVIFSHLSKKQQSFVLKKNRDFFERHFAEGNIVLGVVHDGRLVAQCVILHPTNDNPKTGMVDMALKVKPDKVSIIQGALVHPDYRGNSLHSEMINAWLAIAKAQKRTHVIGEVAVDNHHSWSNALKGGRQIHSIGTDPTDGTQVYNMHAKLGDVAKNKMRAVFNKASAKNSVKCHRSDIESQKKLLAEGYKGVSFDPSSSTIEFERPKKRSATKKPPHNGRLFFL